MPHVHPLGTPEDLFPNLEQPVDLTFWIVQSVIAVAIGLLVVHLVRLLREEFQAWAKSIRAGVTALRRVNAARRARQSGAWEQPSPPMPARETVRAATGAVLQWLRCKLPLACLLGGLTGTVQIAYVALDRWGSIPYLLTLIVGFCVWLYIFMLLEDWADPVSVDPEHGDNSSPAQSQDVASTDSDDASRTERVTRGDDPTQDR